MTAIGRLAVVLLLLAVFVGGLASIRMEGEAPSIDAPESVVVGSGPRSFELVVRDDGAGLRKVKVDLLSARGEVQLTEEDFAGNTFSGAASSEPEHRIPVEIDAGSLSLEDGSAFLRIRARDWSWREGFGGNEARLEIPVTIDTRSPQVRVASGLTYVKRGGAGAVAYSVSEPTVRDGVTVGDTFFRSYRVDGADDARVALFAVPTDAAPHPPIRVVAEDRAGNTGDAGWAVVVQERQLPEANITLPQRFLDEKVRPLAEAEGVDGSDLAAAFREINTVLRRRDEIRIRELIADSATTPYWKGSFEQLANSKVTSRIAEKLRYFVGGKPNSKATHFGYDLASTATAPITAANAGRVVHAGALGIYGGCVMLDHGLGLSTLYGHLSRIDVSVGDVVRQGQAIGLSGETGLAGGDHLHFAVLVGDTYVDPLEWWDPRWVETHIEAHLPPSIR